MSQFGHLLIKLLFVHQQSDSTDLDIYLIDPADPEKQAFWNYEFAASLAELIPFATYSADESNQFAIAEHSVIKLAGKANVQGPFVSFARFQILLGCWRYRLATPVNNGIAVLIRVPPGDVAGPEPITLQVYTDTKGASWVSSIQADIVLRRLLPSPYCL